VPLTTDPVFPIPSVTVEPWPDPVIDELGHDPRSAYVERFWLPVLGPSTSETAPERALSGSVPLLRTGETSPTPISGLGSDRKDDCGRSIEHSHRRLREHLDLNLLEETAHLCV
jgi:hypothetical protein